jgi:hypothetical protein
MGDRYSMQENQSIRDIFKDSFDLILLKFPLSSYLGERMGEILKN